MATTAAADTRPRSSSLSHSSRPTTPLRRISSSSLRQLSLSHSRSRDPLSTQQPLAHLAPLFAELADSVSDLTGKFQDLQVVNQELDGFNEAFAGFLFGLRVNTYTAEFLEAPTKLNFTLASQRAAPPSPPPHAFQHSPSPSPPASPSRADIPTLGGGGGAGNMTMDSEHSFAAPRAVGSARGGTAGRGGGVRGRGRGRGGVGGAGGMTRKKKEELTAFTDSIISTLPIKFREEQPQRSETEKVIHVLRAHPAGLPMSECTQLLLRSVPTHRINDALTALVRAKAVLKVFAQGVTTYRLDPNKFPVV